MSDHKEIWLAPDCGQGQCYVERTWCQNEVYDTCEECGAKPTKYIRADLAEARVRRIIRRLPPLLPEDAGDE